MRHIIGALINEIILLQGEAEEAEFKRSFLIDY
jgi:hypothetical protein